jgi:hypothetical protein
MAKIDALWIEGQIGKHKATYEELSASGVPLDWSSRRRSGSIDIHRLRRSHGYNAADETLPFDYLPDVQRLVQNGIGRPTGGRVRVDNLQGIPARYEPLDRSVVSKPSDDQNAGSTRRPNRNAQDELPNSLLEFPGEGPAGIRPRQCCADRDLPLTGIRRGRLSRSRFRWARGESKECGVRSGGRLSAASDHERKEQHDCEAHGIPLS